MPIDASILGGLNPPPPMQGPIQQIGAVQNLVQQRQQIDEQAAKAKADIEAKAEALKQRQQADADRIAIGKAYQAGLKPDGSFNDDGIIANLTANAPDLVPKAREEIDKHNASALAATTARNAAKKAAGEADAAELDYFGNLAAGAKDPETFGLALAHAKAQGHDVSQIQAMLDKGTPWQQVRDAVIQTSDKQRTLRTSEAAQQATAANQAATQAAAAGRDAETVRHNKAMEAKPTAATVQIGNLSQPPQTFDASRPDPKTANITDPKLGYTPNAIYQNAITFALKNSIPAGSRSMASIPGQKAIQNKAAAIADAAGVDMADLQREYAGATSATRSMMGRYQFSAASAQAAKDNIALASDLAKDVPRTGSPLVNRYSQWATSELGGQKLPALSAFETAVYTAVREYAKVTSGSAGSVAGVTEGATKMADKLLNAAQAPGQFDAVTAVMEKDMANFINPMKAELSKSNDLGPALKRFTEFIGRGVTTETSKKDPLGIR